MRPFVTRSPALDARARGSIVVDAMLDHMGLGVRLLFCEPRIAGNTGATIRLAAITGAELHIAGPFGFDLDDAKLKRAGLDYHDLSHLVVHPSIEDAFAALTPARIFAFTARGSLDYAEISYRPGDVVMFGSEPDGLPTRVLDDPRVSATVRIPMLPGLRSLNLATAAGVVAYEAWRQLGFSGAQRVGRDEAASPHEFSPDPSNS